VPVAERLAILIQALRGAENPTRTTIQTLSTSGSTLGDKKTISALVQPLPAIPEAGALSITADGTYMTRSGFTQFLHAASVSGAALSKLTINENRFVATFTLYARS